MSLRDQIASDVEEVFFNAEDFAEPITYRQAGKEPVQIPNAIRKRAEYKSTSDEGFQIKIVSTDWDFPVTALPGITPRAGDEIDAAEGDETQTFDVVPIDDSTPAVARDVTGGVWQLHTKQSRKFVSA